MMGAEFNSRVLECWDERETESLEAFHSQHRCEPGFIEFLISASSASRTQSAATWLLKRSLEQGIEIEVDLQANLYKKLERLSTWPAKLHVLQSLQWLQIPSQNKKQIERFGRSCLQDDNKFVRTWALTALHRLAQCHEEYAAEMTELLVDARDNGETASLRARARKLLKKPVRPQH